MQEALDEWLVMDEQNMKFHMDQYDHPYRSTVKFLEYLHKKLHSTNNRILDLGCGMGAVLAYILNEGKEIVREGIGIDINKNVVETGKRILHERGMENCKLMTGDIFQLDNNSLGDIDGVISLQTFNILPDYRGIAECMCRLEPKWIAFSTLGFEGLIDYNIKLFDYTKDKGNGCSEVFYNVYSLPKMEEYFSGLGYSKFDYMEFEMDIDLPQTNKLGRGTYTIKTDTGKRIQISGGIMMPWYFVFVEK